MNTDFIKGVVVPMITPIDQDELIDEKAIRSQVDYVIDGGVSGILLYGSNGEFYVIEEDEMERGLKIVVDQVAGRVPVYFGIGAISTKKCIRLAKMAAAGGAAGIKKQGVKDMALVYSEVPCVAAGLPILRRLQMQWRNFPCFCIIILDV